MPPLQPPQTRTTIHTTINLAPIIFLAHIHKIVPHLVAEDDSTGRFGARGDDEFAAEAAVEVGVADEGWVVAGVRAGEAAGVPGLEGFGAGWEERVVVRCDMSGVWFLGKMGEWVIKLKNTYQYIPRSSVPSRYRPNANW